MQHAFYLCDICVISFSLCIYSCQFFPIFIYRYIRMNKKHFIDLFKSCELNIFIRVALLYYGLYCYIVILLHVMHAWNFKLDIALELLVTGSYITTKVARFMFLSQVQLSLSSQRFFYLTCKLLMYAHLIFT